MELRTYLDSLPAGGITEMAGRLGISPVYLRQLAARQDGRQPHPELAVQIEADTRGLVMRWDLRPNDWRGIWPELSGRKGAPAQKPDLAQGEPAAAQA